MSRAGGVVEVKSSFTMQSSFRRSKFLSGALTLALAVMGCIALSSVTYGAADNTSVSISCPAAFVNETVTCTVTITNTGGGSGNGTPQGSVGVSDPFGTSPGAPLCSGSCSVNYTPTSNAGTHTLSLSFTSLDATKWNNSTGSGSATVNLRTTSTSISCSPTTVVVDDSISCTVTVTDTAAGTASDPVGTITTGQSAGTGTATTCSLASGSCTFDYTPTDTTSPRTVSTR